MHREANKTSLDAFKAIDVAMLAVERLREYLRMEEEAEGE